MSSSSLSKLLVFPATLALSLGPTLARADSTTFITGAYFDATAENRAADLELGFKFKVFGVEPKTKTNPKADDFLKPAQPGEYESKQLNIRPYLHAPFGDSDAQIVRVDRQARAAQVGVGIDYVSATNPLSGPGRSTRLSLAAEFGTKAYSFKPIGAMSSTSEQHQSFNATAAGLFGFYAGSKGGGAVLVYPQVSASYGRAYEDADKASFVVPGENGAPDTVTTRVVEAPSATPTMTLRLGSMFSVGRLGAPLAFGLFGIANTSGENYKPWGNGKTYRGELWTYWYSSASPNNRAGLAVFLESARPAAGADSETTFGVLLRFKLNADTFEY